MLASFPKPFAIASFNLDFGSKSNSLRPSSLHLHPYPLASKVIIKSKYASSLSSIYSFQIVLVFIEAYGLIPTSEYTAFIPFSLQSCYFYAKSFHPIRCCMQFAGYNSYFTCTQFTQGSLLAD